eukprot:g22.t1
MSYRRSRNAENQAYGDGFDRGYLRGVRDAQNSAPSTSRSSYDSSGNRQGSERRHVTHFGHEEQRAGASHALVLKSNYDSRRDENRDRRSELAHPNARTTIEILDIDEPDEAVTYYKKPVPVKYVVEKEYIDRGARRRDYKDYRSYDRETNLELDQNYHYRTSERNRYRDDYSAPSGRPGKERTYRNYQEYSRAEESRRSRRNSNEDLAERDIPSTSPSFLGSSMMRRKKQQDNYLEHEDEEDEDEDQDEEDIPMTLREWKKWQKQKKKKKKDKRGDNNKSKEKSWKKRRDDKKAREEALKKKEEELKAKERALNEVLDQATQVLKKEKKRAKTSSSSTRRSKKKGSRKLPPRPPSDSPSEDDASSDSTNEEEEEEEEGEEEEDDDDEQAKSKTKTSKDEEGNNNKSDDHQSDDDEKDQASEEDEIEEKKSTESKSPIHYTYSNKKQLLKKYRPVQYALVVREKGGLISGPHTYSMYSQYRVGKVGTDAEVDKLLMFAKMESARGSLGFTKQFSIYSMVNGVTMSSKGEEHMVAFMHFSKSSSFERLNGSTVPRSLTVVIPSGRTKNFTQGLPVNYDLAEAVRTDQNIPCSHIVLCNKPPQFDNGCYRLHFNGRVKEASVKNFQLISKEDVGRKKSMQLKYTDNIMMQFGKIAKDKFHCDFKKPLSPLLAFAISLVQFNY